MHFNISHACSARCAHCVQDIQLKHDGGRKTVSHRRLSDAFFSGLLSQSAFRLSSALVSLCCVCVLCYVRFALGVYVVAAVVEWNESRHLFRASRYVGESGGWVCCFRCARKQKPKDANRFRNHPSLLILNRCCAAAAVGFLGVSRESEYTCSYTISSANSFLRESCALKHSCDASGKI